MQKKKPPQNKPPQPMKVPQTVKRVVLNFAGEVTTFDSGTMWCGAPSCVGLANRIRRARGTGAYGEYLYRLPIRDGHAWAIADDDMLARLDGVLKSGALPATWVTPDQAATWLVRNGYNLPAEFQVSVPTTLHVSTAAWSSPPVKKRDLMDALRMTRPSFDAYTSGIEKEHGTAVLREAGSRQQWQIRLDLLDSVSRAGVQQKLSLIKPARKKS